MPKKKQTRKQWIAKIRRDVGPYFKVTCFVFVFVGLLSLLLLLLFF